MTTLEFFANELRLARAAIGFSQEQLGQVSARLERQEILTRENPPMFVAVLDETALRRPIGEPKVMHDQLLHLVEMVERSRTLLQVIPLSAGMYTGLNGPFVIASFDGASDVVYLDTQLHGQVVERAEDVAAAKCSWEALRGEALPRNQSIDLMMEVAETWIRVTRSGLGPRAAGTAATPAWRSLASTTAAVPFATARTQPARHSCSRPRSGMRSSTA